MTEHVKNLHALRGAAALMVVVYHLWCLEDKFGVGTLILREVRWFGLAGVDVFFALSGFLITATNRKTLGRPAAAPRYLFRRFWRVYPTYWVVMLLAFAYLRATHGGPFVEAEILRSWPWWAALVAVPVPNVLVGQAWTLHYEVMFYAAFGLLLLAPPRWAAAALAAWAAAVLARAAGPPPASMAGHLAFSPFVLEFLGGCGTAWLVGRGVRAGWRVALVLAVVYTAVAVTVAAAVLPGPYPHSLTAEWPRVLVYGPPAVLLVYGLAAADGRWPRQPPGWLLRLGDASYSVYLLHHLVLDGAKHVGLAVPHTNGPHLLWVAGTLAAAVGAGVVLHRWVERPLLALGKRRLPDLPAPRLRRAIRLPFTRTDRRGRP